MLRLACALVLLLPVEAVVADSAYYQRFLFDNSITPDRYYYSGGKVSEPSLLKLDHERLPVETGHYLTAPNSLRLEWTSKAGGGWVAEIRVNKWRNRLIYFRGEILYLWCYSAQPIRPDELPRIVLRDTARNFTAPLNITNYAPGGIPAAKWTQVAVPLHAFVTTSIHPFDPHTVDTISFLQAESDAAAHVMLVDEIKIDDARINSGNLESPAELVARGFDSHIDLSWREVNNPLLERYVIYRSLDGGSFSPVGIQVPGVNRYDDFLGKSGLKATYKVTAGDRRYGESAFSNTASASTHAMSDDELLTMMEEACFRYYWEAGAHPASGMIRENIPGDDRIVATGATGFGVMALIVGVDRGFITREQGLERLRRITEFLEHADRFHGAWAHFMDGATGHRIPVFGQFENGGDLVETAFLMEGLLAARQYFKSDGNLFGRLTKLWQTVEWDWYRRTPDGDALYWHWSPEYSWYINHRLTGWNETMITYLLAIASPTHGVPASLYYTGWAGQTPAAVKYRQSWSHATAGDHYVNDHAYYGIKLDVGVDKGGPLFFAHYSFMGFDPRGIRDRFTNYFKNNIAMAKINRAWCIQNPGHYKGYGARNWGLTASDDPWGYMPHEPKLPEDNGAMTPTGALSSFPYTPEASMEALKFFYRELGDRLWGEYGVRDAFHLGENWFANIYMGLNQAPIAVMIENYRTGLVWNSFMANPEIRPMLDRIGFKPDANGKLSHITK
jgi:hypothetical protein